MNISEGRDILDVITTISATDIDKNQRVTFAMAAENSAHFQIDQTSGNIIMPINN